MQDLFNKLTGVSVFTKEDLELIACGFKSELKEVRNAIKNIELLETKSKFENKKMSMEKYKNMLGQAHAYQLIIQEISNLLRPKEQKDERNVIDIGKGSTKN